MTYDPTGTKVIDSTGCGEELLEPDEQAFYEWLVGLGKRAPVAKDAWNAALAYARSERKEGE